ncbi:MAG TPA: protein kinase, partial [Thermoanaerobaculia bacterium]|nr:protein kinase [Thermoanaerobaculia bacterium]
MLSHLRNQLGTIGRYRVLERLGRGGMGEVYLAEDPTLRRQVAIKLLAEEFAGDPQRRHRFVREAVAASALTHPHVAIVYEAGETADGEAFICME